MQVREPRRDPRYAQRLLQRLDLPTEAALVVSDRRYWTPEFCRLYCDACDEILFADPRSGLPMARIAPRLANLLPASRYKADLIVHSLAVLGGANRAVGALVESDGLYRTAFAVSRRPDVSAIERADLHRRYSNLLLEQRRPTQALDSADLAVEILESAAPRGSGDYCLGAALVQRGVVRIHREELAEAQEDFGLALLALDPRQNERAYYSAIHNLAYALSRDSDLVRLHRASHHLRRAEQMLAGRDDCQARFKLHWVEASLLQRLGATHRAEKSLRLARQGFARVGARLELVLSSLELAMLLEVHGDLRALAEVTEETLHLCRELGASAEALTILGTWKRAVEEQTATTATLRRVGEDYEACERTATIH